jgi:hypothetical protein
MRLRQWSSAVVLPLVLLGLATVVLSCAPAEAGPRAWIDWPTEGFETNVGTTVTLIAHAYAADGVGEVRLEVDGQPYRLVSPDRPGEQFVETSTEWFAEEPGIYLLSVTAIDVNGQEGNPANVTVSITGEGPVFTVTAEPEEPEPAPSETPEGPVSTVAATETPPAATATAPPPTGTPLAATATPPPPTATPLPCGIVSFEVNRTQITVGQCVRFNWRVEGSPSAIYFDGEGATSPDSRQKCPSATRDFVLRAECPRGADTQSIRVVVVEPSPTPDTEGPPAPSLISPTGNAEQSCGAVTLRWRRPNDPSGISTYYVKVEKVTGTFTSGAWTTTDTELTIPAAWLECGQGYQWAVRAEDGAGNVGPWSTGGSFSVTIS